MKKETKMMLNMAESIAKINKWAIDRMDLQKHKAGDIEYYVLYVTYEGGNEVIIRSDCTVVGYDD